MPTILRSGPYRLFFYSADHHEPPHVHAGRDDSEAKFWLEPVRLARSQGYGRAEKVVSENERKLLEAWHEYFGD